MADLNFMFMLLFVAILMALGIANFVQSKTNGKKMGDNFFGLLYILAALALIFYKIQNP